jgi:tetratricopeptide (TPR) repeat protein
LPCAVDQRADVYALAVLLYEALGGRLPGETGRPPRLDRLNPRVSAGLADLVEKGLSPDPARRQAGAADLGDDLRRHLRDLPLRTVPNRSLRERWRKWRRRRPGALRGKLLLGAVALALFAFAALLAADYRRRTGEAEAALLEGHEQWAGRGLHEVGLGTLRRGLEHLRYLPGSRELAGKLAAEMRRAERARLARELRELAEKMRGLAGLEVPARQRRQLGDRCRAIWQERCRLVEELGLRRDAATARDLLDVLVLWQEWLGGRPGAGGARAQLEALLGPRAAERPQSAWELSSLARSLLHQGRLAEAARLLGRARRLEPADRWTNFLLGQCAFRQGRHEEAVAAFSLCVGADPGNPVHYYNRALARGAAGREEDAIADLDQALKLDARFAPALVERGLVRLRQGRHDDAGRDLRAALGAGAPPAAAHYHLARLALARGDTAEARRRVEEALRHDPKHAEARRLRERLGE